VTAGERTEQRPAYALRAHGERCLTELQHRGGNGFRKPLGDRSRRGGLEADLVPLVGVGRHVPVTRRRARSWRGVAMSAPGSRRPNVARLSEIRATASVSPRISSVISRPSRSSTDSRTASANHQARALGPGPTPNPIANLQVPPHNIVATSMSRAHAADQHRCGGDAVERTPLPH